MAERGRDGAHRWRPTTRAQVLLSAPNVVCWLRAALLAAAIAAAHCARPLAAWWLAAASLALDGLDGLLARRLGQATAVGAALDVTVDNATRGWLWCGALPGGAGAAPMALEATVFAFTHAAGGAEWKREFFAAAPRWAAAVMADGFRTPLGAAAVAGLMGCPLWAWAVRHLPPGCWQSLRFWGLLLVPCRLLAAAVEAWVLAAYCGRLADADLAAAAAR
ncbi:MAG: hypothetical protein J3K34DRAFT_407636 [Monoraphidium minutum]|nr:MAG: hypothetical protein J3K34DRAFT_407636 [Monoraphidium minutum]